MEQIFQRSVKPILQSTISSALFLAIYLQSALRPFKFGGFITPRQINSYKFYRIVSLRCCVYQSIKYHRVSSGETSTVPGESPSGEQAIGRNIRIPSCTFVHWFTGNLRFKPLTLDNEPVISHQKQLTNSLVMFFICLSLQNVA